MNKPTTPKAIRFMAKKPTYIGTVHGVDLYEHPVLGDESPLVAITPAGRVLSTEHWELPLFGLGADIPNVPYQRDIPASKTRNTGAAKDRRNAKKRRAKK